MKHYVIGEFTDPDDCVRAVLRLRGMGLERLDAYTPYPVHGIDEALGLPRSTVPLVAISGGVLGALGGYYMQVWMNAIDFPINVGNRPPHGFWTNIPITFESGVLLAVLSIFFSSIFKYFQLPRPYHPLFESERFRSASLDGFWVSIETEDESAISELEQNLRELEAHKVHTVAEST